MERFEESLLNAKKKLMSAEHMISVTYGIVHDPRILMSVLESSFQAVSYAVDSILFLEAYYSEIEEIGEEFEGKFDTFRLNIVPNLHIDEKYVTLIRNLHDYVSGHKDSPVEFSKNGEFVICDDEYHMKTINLEETKKLVSESKSFINLTDTLVKGRDVIYRRSKK